MTSLVQRYRVAILLALIAVGSVRIVSTYNIFSHTVDEPAHIACGMEWLDQHRYTLDPLHPPLARIFMAMGPFLAGERSQPELGGYMDGFRILGSESHYDRMLFLARLGVLPFFWIASFAVYALTQRLADWRAALWATIIFTACPSILAHAGLTTTDFCLTAFVPLSVFTLLWWSDRPNWIRSLALGASIGLTVSAKMSAFVYLPVAFMVVALWGLPVRQWPARAFAVRKQIPSILAAALLSIWAVYRFSVGEEPFLHWTVPFPELWIGLQNLAMVNAGGTGAYLCGKCSIGGFWYYFPVALLIKLPLPLLILLGAAIWLLLSGKKRRGFGLPLFIAAAFLTVTVFSRINIGTRHVLPVVPMLTIAAGMALDAILRARQRTTFWFGALLVLWYAGEGVRAHPDYLAYTNEIALSQPERFLVDSDLDWGQDMKRLRKRLNELRVKEIAFLPFGTGYLLAGNTFPKVLPSDLHHPTPGWNAVSLTVWKLTDNCPIRGVYPAKEWPDFYQPAERVGKSVLLFHFP